MDSEVTGPGAGRQYRTTDVAVSGGLLRVGIWEPAHPPTATIVAVHGVTASHLAWQWLVDALPGVRVVAPDLRGRGRSAGIAGPAGMAAHADDLAEVFSALGLGPTLVVGHSMGAFVAVVFAHRHPDLTAGLVLLDGGLPLSTPANLEAEELIEAILGPTAARLRMRFDGLDDYLAFWREHPAFGSVTDPRLRAYFAYDLVAADDLVSDGSSGAERPRRQRPATSYDVTTEDTVDLTVGSALRDAWEALGDPSAHTPVDWVTVPLGLRAETPGLYSAGDAARLASQYPAVAAARWEGLNHYTLVMSDGGAARVAGVITQSLRGGGPSGATPITGDRAVSG